MADVGRILRALMELKRKAEGNFCEIKTKISRLESRFALLTAAQDSLKKDLEVTRTQQMLVQPVEAARRRGGGRRRKARRRRRATRGRQKKASVGRVVRGAVVKAAKARRPATAKRA